MRFLPEQVFASQTIVPACPYSPGSPGLLQSEVKLKRSEKRIPRSAGGEPGVKGSYY